MLFPSYFKDHIPNIISSTQKSVKRVSTQCRNSVGRVPPRARHANTLEIRYYLWPLENFSWWSRLEAGLEHQNPRWPSPRE
eukprot:2758119-Pyramimonas_sp.AAC.1